MDEELYNRERAEIDKQLDLLERQRLENHKLWDAQILGLSTIILGLTLTVLNEIISFDHANYKILLYISWVLLWGTIVVTIINFYVAEESSIKWKDILIMQAKHSQTVHFLSQKLDTKLKELELTGDIEKFQNTRGAGIAEIQHEIDIYDATLTEKNRSHVSWNNTVLILNRAKTATFILALSSTVTFIVFNL